MRETPQLLIDHRARMAARRPVTGERVRWHKRSDILNQEWNDTGEVGYVYTNGFCILLSDDKVHGRTVGWDEITPIGSET